MRSMATVIAGTFSST